MFFTGAFDLDLCSTVQKPHEGDPWDDDVVSTLSDDDRMLFRDGYVSNVGSVVTIHIGNESMNRLEDVKKWFSLGDSSISEIKTEIFTGWTEE